MFKEEDSDYELSSVSEDSDYNPIHTSKKRKLENGYQNINLALFNLPNELFHKLDYYEGEDEESEEDNNNTMEISKKIKEIKSDIDSINSSALGKSLSLIDKVVLSNLDVNIKADIVSKLENENMEISDKNKLYTWVNQVLKLPINVYKDINKENFNVNCFLSEARRKLDQTVYGMENTKEEIIDFLVRYMSGAKNTGTVIGLKGAKGVGKTKLCRALADILDLPLYQISLGGITDSSTLIGFDSSYVGSKCGKIASFAQQAKCMNFILYIDEIDKASLSKGNDVHGVLTHLFDETQNNTFQDLYFDGVPLDLSRVLFIASFNDEEKIDPIVLNRMKLITIKDITLDDKITIVQKYILPEINYNNIKLTDDLIKYVITKKTIPEKGMRNIKKNIETIINRMNTILILKNCENKNKIADGFSYKKILNSQEEMSINTIDILLNSTKLQNEIPNEILHSLYI